GDDLRLCYTDASTNTERRQGGQGSEAERDPRQTSTSDVKDNWFDRYRKTQDNLYELCLTH
ncbi:MAG: hypothetical protein M1815_000583, partial [Lichina confinis]